MRLLQRDLVSFAEAASACVGSFPLSTDPEDVAETISRANGNVVGAKNRQRLMELHDSAWMLLLHLSCLAPIAPLSADAPFQSHLTGLEAFTKEVSDS